MSVHQGDAPVGSTAPSAKGTAGTILGSRYQLTSWLGRGRAGVVYLAEDLHLAGRPVAVKIAVGATGGEDIGRTGASRDHLMNEARALLAIRHPATPQLIDVLVQRDRFASVLEYLPGRTLRDIAGGTSPTEAAVLEWGVRLCDLLAALQSQREPITHGAIRTDHCMVLPGGRLVLFDFGSAAPASDAGLQEDTHAVARLLSELLAPRVPAETPPSARPTTQRSGGSGDMGLRAALQRAATEASPSAQVLRRLLVEYSQLLGVTWGICRYCQAAIRPDTLRCGVCGSTLGPDAEHSSALRGMAEPGSSASTAPVSPIAASTAPAQPAPLARPRVAGSPRVGQPKRGLITYADRLRGVGQFIDQEGLRRVTIVDGGDGIVVRGRSDGVGRLGSLPAGTVVVSTLSEEDLEALSSSVRRRHDGAVFSTPRRETPGRVPPGLLGSQLFSKGYKDRLRALGAELDGLKGISLLTIIETSTEIYLDYDLTAEAMDKGATHRHLVLSGSDIETIVATAIGRRSREPGGGSLAALIQREQARENRPRPT